MVNLGGVYFVGNQLTTIVKPKGYLYAVSNANNSIYSKHVIIP